MQSGYGKTDKWILEYETNDPSINRLWDGKFINTLQN